MTIISRMFHGINIGQRDTDGYLNITAMAKAYELSTGQRKDVKDWLDTERAKQYIEYLSVKTTIPVSLLIQVKRGGKSQGTWAHPKLAIPFATWLSVEFEFQVSEWVEEWITLGFSTKEQLENRLRGKTVRRTFTDAMQAYMDRHPELSPNTVKFMYSNASDAVNLKVFGRRAAKLRVDLNTPVDAPLRDSYNSYELLLVQEVEDVAMRLIDEDDMPPHLAAREAARCLRIPVQTRVEG